MKNSLLLKTLLGYVLIVLLPVSVLYFYTTQTTTQLLLDNEGDRRQHQLVVATASLQREMERMETVFELVQQNTWVLEYLRYPYETDWEPVYNFLRYIRPNLQYIELSNANIQHIRLYSDSPTLLLGGRFFPMAAYPGDPDEDREGRWTLDAGGQLYYRLAITDSDYITVLGYVECAASPTLLGDYLVQLNAQSGTVSALFDDTGAVRLGAALPGVGALPPSGGTTRDQDYVLNRVSIPRLQLNAVTAWPQSDLTRATSQIILRNGAVLLGLLLLLSAAYTFFMRHLIRRLMRLSRHIKEMPAGVFSPYAGKPGHDEIGELIYTYNQMAERNEKLLADIQRAERLKSAAEYDALQAKIEPHFLYGTLESIRMMADEAGTEPIAGVILTFAKLLRYSLSPSGGHTTLGAETKNARRYLELQKLRFGDRLVYAFDLQEAALNIPCPQFIVQPLVENCVTHGLNKRRGTVRILIQLRADASGIHLSVEDDGQSIHPYRLRELHAMLRGGQDADWADTHHESGYALYNINARLQLFYAEGSGLWIDNRQGGGVCCTLHIHRQEVPHEDSAGR